jgi:hypothetical protein
VKFQNKNQLLKKSSNSKVKFKNKIKKLKRLFSDVYALKPVALKTTADVSRRANPVLKSVVVITAKISLTKKYNFLKK